MSLIGIELPDLEDYFYTKWEQSYLPDELSHLEGYSVLPSDFDEDAIRDFYLELDRDDMAI